MRQLLAILLALTLIGAPAAPARAAGPTAPSMPEAAAPDLTGFAIRHGQLSLHQGFGLATLASMAVTAGLGVNASLTGRAPGALSVHTAMAGLTTGLYVTTATLALSAPPGIVAAPDGPWSSARLHRGLGWAHMAGLAGTVGLGLASTLTPLAVSEYHGLAAYTTLGLMALSAGVIAFGY